jgi:hypothetical protein
MGRCCSKPGLKQRPHPVDRTEALAHRAGCLAQIETQRSESLTHQLHGNVFARVVEPAGTVRTHNPHARMSFALKRGES